MVTIYNIAWPPPQSHTDGWTAGENTATRQDEVGQKREKSGLYLLNFDVVLPAWLRATSYIITQLHTRTLYNISVKFNNLETSFNNQLVSAVRIKD